MATNYPPPPPQQPQQPQYAAGPGVAQTNQLGLWAMITGIAGAVFVWIPYISIIAPLLGIAAIVLGIMGNGKARQLGGAGRGQSIAGIVLGAVTLVLFILAIVVIGAAISAAT